MSAASAPLPGAARAWVLAARPKTLPAAVVPVVVGAASAVHEFAMFRWPLFVATFASALLIQIGTNFANDYSDFHRGADHEGRVGPVRVTQSGLISHASVRRGIVVAFGLAAFLGGFLAWAGGWPIVAIGVLSILAALAYTGGPWPFGYHGLGDAFVFLFFGVVAVTGTAYLQSGRWSPFALALSVPVGLLVTNVLVINNLRDIHTDRAAGKHTLAVLLGERATRVQYALLLGAAYVVVAAVAASSPSRRWLLLTFLTLPLATSLARTVLVGMSGRELNTVLARTGKLLLLFGLLLAAGLVAGAVR